MMRGMFRRKLKDFAEQQKENLEYVSLLDRFKQGAGEETPNIQKQYQSDINNQILLDIESEYDTGSMDEYRRANMAKMSGLENRNLEIFANEK